jgi:hypothetical protein
LHPAGLEPTTFGSGCSLDRSDLNGNLLSSDGYISIGRIFFSYFPRCREMPGDSLDGRLLSLPQLAHAPIPFQRIALIVTKKSRSLV